MGKMISAVEIKAGNTITIDNASCIVKSIDISKTGKHGASKCRIEAEGIIDRKKKVIAVPGHERFEVPLILKKRGQVLSLGEKTSIMDLESFETLDVITDEDIKNEIKEGDNVEYWDIEGKKIIKRKI